MGPLPAALGKFFLSASLVSGMSAGDLQASAEQTTCTYDDPSKTVTITAPNVGPVFVFLTVQSGAIMYEEFTFETTSLPPPQPCGTATTTNTDIIHAQGGGPEGLLLSVDETTGTFTPGFTPEATGVSEIEFELQSIGAVIYGGSPNPAVVRLGTLGANINGDDDADVTFLASPAGFGFVGGPGSDDIAATGGFGTGDPSGLLFAAFGGDGTDVLIAGLGAAQLDGSGGNDVVTGGPARDFVSGGSGNDRLLGGESKDTIRGDSGNDRLLGGASNDLLDGGRGRDRCIGGPGKDKIENCEH